MAASLGTALPDVTAGAVPEAFAEVSSDRPVAPGVPAWAGEAGAELESADLLFLGGVIAGGTGGECARRA